MPAVEARIPPGALPRVPAAVECEGLSGRGHAVVDTGATRSAICARRFQAPPAGRRAVRAVSGPVELPWAPAAVSIRGGGPGWQVDAYLAPDLQPGVIAILGMDVLSQCALSISAGRLLLRW